MTNTTVAADLPDWRDQSFGTRVRVALWLASQVGEGGTFSSQDLRAAMPGVEQEGPLSPLRQTTQPSVHSAQVFSRSPKAAVEGAPFSGAVGRKWASAMVTNATASTAKAIARS